MAQYAEDIQHHLHITHCTAATALKEQQYVVRIKQNLNIRMKPRYIIYQSKSQSRKQRTRQRMGDRLGFWGLAYIREVV